MQQLQSFQIILLLQTIFFTVEKFLYKNSAPFFNCMLKINNQLTEDAQDLDVVMLMYNLLNYSKNFRKTIGSFCNYYPDIPNAYYLNPDNIMKQHEYFRQCIFQKVLIIKQN